MNNNPLVSVIVPAYNAEKFVKKAIDSIISQTYKNLEIWLLDDASSDNTKEILLSYKDERIRHYFTGENTKKIGIVNKVLTKVNGDYIAFQDADDWSELDRIEKQMDAIQENESVGIVFCPVIIHDNNSDKGYVIPAPKKDLEIKEMFFKYGKLNQNKNIACATMLVEREIIEGAGGYHPYFYGKAASDIYWVYTILKQTNAMTVDSPLYHVLRTDNSFTQQLHSYKNIKSAYIWKVLRKLIEYDQKGVDLLNKSNELQLKNVELEACEAQLKDAIKDFDRKLACIKNSVSYRFGNFFVRSLSFLKNQNEN